MCDFPIPSLLFYAYVPALMASLFFSFFIFLSDRKSQINRNLFIFVLFFCFWIINDFIAWLFHNQVINLLSERMSIIETFSLAFFIYFVYAFLGMNLNIKRKIYIFLPFLPLVLFMFTDYNVYVVDKATCQNQNGILYIYVFLVTIIYSVWLVKILISGYKKASTDARAQIRIIIGSIIFLIAWFSLVVAIRYFLLITDYNDWIDNVFLFVPFGMVIFIGMLTYAITKYQMFNMKLLFAQVIVIALAFFLAAELFFAKSAINQIFILITLVITIGFGYVLVKSVKAEIQKSEELELANKEISERKEQLQKMADSLAIANDKLKILDNAKTEFISMASHQLRTPVTGIKGYLSMLIEGSYGAVSSEQKIVLQKTFDSNERMVNLIEDLLNVSRIESGRLEYEFSNTKIEDLCAEVIDTLYPKAKNQGLYLDYKKPNINLPELWIDGGKVREVISNLVDNAIKYTPRGGVSLTINLCDKKELNCLLIPHIRITVSDTGIGVPKEEMSYLFEKFSRGKDINRLNTGGTGLGLFVGRKMIEGNGGKVWVESGGKDKGSRFIIELPIGKNQELLGGMG
jgi:signal transduction histidine kinase